jgi:hypothetical protein
MCGRLRNGSWSGCRSIAEFEYCMRDFVLNWFLVLLFFLLAPKVLDSELGITNVHKGNRINRCC